MRTVKWNAFLSGLCACALALGVVAAQARADVTIEKGASILIFPKVVSNSSAETFIQIANIGNSMVHARCNYVTVSGSSLNETDFDIWLTKQQPTIWVAGRGRGVANPNAGWGGFGQYGAGFIPGAVPPVASGFAGELKCVEITETGEPSTGNHLKGEATIKYWSNDQVAKYNAIGIQGNPDVQPENPLRLDGEVYDACPDHLIMNHFAELALDPIALDATSVRTRLTLMACQEDFENQRCTRTTVQFLVYNEFEEVFSASMSFCGWKSTMLTDIDSPSTPANSVFSAGVLGSDVASTVITPITGSGGLHSVVGIIERNTSGTTSATAAPQGYSATNLHGGGDLIPSTPESIRMAGR